MCSGAKGRRLSVRAFGVAILMRPVPFGVAALLAMVGQAVAQQVAPETTGVLPQEAPASPIEKGGDAVTAEPTEPTGAGMIMVTKRPIEVLAGPSSSASVLYGFPAGRPFRLIGREAGFAQIQDLKSGSTGWIDETALATSPPAVAGVSVSSGAAPAPSNQNATIQTPEPRGIFGLGRNSGRGVLSGFLGGVFGTR
jgi:hypothetical protein